MQASYEVFYEGFMLHSKYSDSIANNDTDIVTLASDDKVTENTANIMKSILQENENTMYVIMWGTCVKHAGNVTILGVYSS